MRRPERSVRARGGRRRATLFVAPSDRDDPALGLEVFSEQQLRETCLRLESLARSERSERSAQRSREPLRCRQGPRADAPELPGRPALRERHAAKAGDAHRAL